MFLIFIKLVIFFLFVWIGITQIIIPVLTNRKLFPMFDDSKTSVEDQLREVNSKMEIARLNIELEKKQKELDNLTKKEEKK